jgi:hypothetical protein
MSTRQRIELLCGLGALVLGLLLPLVAYLRPGIGHSPGTGYALTLHPGFVGTELPYIVGSSVPILGIAVGSVVDSLHRSRVARVVLWTATVLLFLEACALAPSRGPILGLSILLGQSASLMAVDARPPRGMPPALPSPRLRFRARRLILAGAIIVILLAGFEVGIRQVAPDAVQARAYTVDNGLPFATRDITDARTVADLYTRINDLPAVWYSAINRCPAPHANTVFYQIDFTRSGVLIEGAALVEKGCSVWDVVRGGIPVAHNDPDGQTQVILSEAQLP